MVVYLVGAGPGDPELITVKGMRLLKEADAIVHDHLGVHPDLLTLAKPGCKRFYVGKKAGHHYRTQTEINELLVELGSTLNTVVRLKGGDPFLFGRGGEEAEILVENGIKFEVVPGVTSVTAAPAYAGIPLTHRSFNSQLAITTGHKSKNSEETINFQEFPPVTIILMGYSNRKAIAEQLKKSNQYHDTTPVAVISKGSQIDQQVITTTIGQLAEIEAPTPALLVVGEIVKLRNKLNWYDRKLEMIKGKKLLITQDESRNKRIKCLLENIGMDVEFKQLITLKKRKFTFKSPLEKYDVIVFTSKNGVKVFTEDHSLPLDKEYFVIGPTTQSELEKLQINASCPEVYNSIALGKLIQNTVKTRSKILLIRSANASRDLYKMLEVDYNVEEIHVYEVLPQKITQKLLEKVDVIFITAGTIAKSLEEHVEFLKNEEPIIVSIGPMASRALREIGLSNFIVSPKHTIEGMLNALLRT